VHGSLTWIVALSFLGSLRKDGAFFYFGLLTCIGSLSVPGALISNGSLR
jgi:hypothetical protein